VRRYRYFRLDCRACGEHDEVEAYHTRYADGFVWAEPFWFVVDRSTFGLELAKTAERPDLGLPERPPEIERAVCPCGSDDIVIRIHETIGTGPIPHWPELDPTDRPEEAQR